MDATVKATNGLRVRQAPINGDILGSLPFGIKIDVTDEGNGWSSLELSAGGVKLSQRGFVSNEWLTFQNTNPIPVPVPTPKGKTISVGLNTLYSTEHAVEALSRGCNMILTINNVAGAAELKRQYPKAEIIVRKIFYKGYPPDVDFALKELGVNANNPPLNYVLLNEDDHMSFRKDMKARSEIDVAFARKMKEKAPNARFLAYMYPAACNAADEQGFASDIQKYYTPHFNSGLMDVDHHPYEPNFHNLFEMRANGPQHVWWATRYRFLFQCCGFNYRPNSVWASEAGLDEQSVGGFNQVNPSKEEFGKWMDEYARLLEEPFMCNGQMMDSPVKGVCIFQYREKNSASGSGWEGYSVEKYFDWFTKRWNYENQS